jgi:hypothetical protein
VTAVVLSALTALFVARVLGQALVASASVAWLPPMNAWYSGLLPYPLLLPVQIAIIAAQVVVDVQIWRGAGALTTPRPGLGRGLRVFSVVYAAAMLVRAILTRTHAIPILFHWVLAAYLFTLGRFYGRFSAGRRPRAADR